MKKSLLAISILLAILSDQMSGQSISEPTIIRSEFIYQQSDVPFPSCHASTIVQTGKGFIVAWFGGTREKNPDVCIWTSRYEKGKWTKPVEVANGIQYKGKRYPCWNPVLFESGKKILLFYKVGPSPSEWWGELKTSPDEGKSWSSASRLPEGILGPVKDKPVLIGNGYLLCPSSSEDKGWRLHMEFTADNGMTWERTEDLNDTVPFEAIQPAILIHQGKIQLLCRSTCGKILTSWSSDNGRSWSPLEPTLLPNPNSGIDAVTLMDGRHLVIYNHLDKGRNMLNAAISNDGIDWEGAFIIEADDKGKEFSYPAVIQSRDGLIHIIYTWNRKLIRHVVVDPGKIKPHPLVGSTIFERK
jgi:predicted neuraminidase